MALTVNLTKLSPNFNRSPNDEPLLMPDRCRTVIIHCTRSTRPQNPTEYTGTLNFMATPGTTSSHLVIGRERGQIARVVPDNRQAWHAAEDNDNAWGIELCQGVDADGFTQVQWGQLVHAARYYTETFGVPARHAATSTDPGFIGHQETAQGRRDGKSDPGTHFDWDWFIAALKGGTMPAPTLEEIALANASYVHFVRNGFNLADLSPRDKQAIAAQATSIPGLPAFLDDLAPGSVPTLAGDAPKEGAQ